jgi:putative transposase
MARSPNMPNRENVSLADLEVAIKASPTQRGYVRMSAIRTLCLGYSHSQAAELHNVSERTITRWVNSFNDRGIDGLIDRPRRGRPKKISPERGAEYRDLIRHPEKADQRHWTGKKFHGYVTKKLDNEIGYRTVLRWLHEEGFRLKVPRSWPNGQDEEKRKAFMELLRTLLSDPDTDLWFLDQTGVEGDPRPRRRWALRGEKITVPYQGAHIRMSVTGMVCPRTGEFYALLFSHTDTRVFQVFLDNANQDIQLQRKRNVLICDNASWHKSASLNWGNFERIYLPPYSPDLNPIEKLWLVMKAEWFSDFVAKDANQLIDRLCHALNWVVDRKTGNKKTCAIRTEL